MPGKKQKKLTFEEALARLEEIVGLMEEGKCPLDEALKRYEEGVKLVNFCEKTLDAAEKKIEILTGGEDEGSPRRKPFPAEAGGDAPAAETGVGANEGGEELLF